MRLYTVYYISVNCSLYMFRVVNPPIIRSTYNSNYSIWHWSNRLCYLPLSWRIWSCARCCKYSYMCSWWWVYLPPEACRASSLEKYNKLCIVTFCWTIIDRVLSVIVHFICENRVIKTFALLGC